MLIISCGIKKVIAEKKYHAGSESEKMFTDAGIELEYFDETIEQYEKQ
jgi:dCMP deaminase